MSITIEVDEEILRKAEVAANIYDPSALFQRLLEKEITLSAPASETRAQETARYFAALGGSMPDLEMPRRRRVEDYLE